MTNKKVSIVIPALNAEFTLARTLESLLCQSYPQSFIEIIVVDNNSNDGTRDLAASHPVKVVHAERRNRSFARNTGVQASTGEIICFMDSDCEAQANWISSLVEIFEDARIGAAQGVIAPRGSEVVSYASIRHEHLGQTFIDTKGCAIRREVFLEVGGFDESLLRCEDIDLGWKISLSKWKTEFSDATGVICGLPKGVLFTLRRAFESAIGLRQVHSKWREPFGFTFIIILKGFLAVARRNEVRHARKARISFHNRFLYLLDDVLTGIFYILLYPIFPQK